MKKVFVGLSGGVDSSVAAALLKERGYDVTGVYMKNWTQDIGEFESLWQEELSDAKAVADQLGIEFKVFDFEAEYKQRVVEYLIREYQSGRTPNPDIMCNQEIKFKLFLETSLSEGADMIATGHYSRVQGDTLLKGLDENKDQSYFLYRVNKNALEKTIMPIGELEKPKVREIAKSLKLVTADKPDSQGICFIGEVGIKYFLSQYIEPTPGPVVDIATSKVVGQHDGVEFFTIGQRHGLNIGGGLPYYVVGKNVDTATIYVTNDLSSSKLWSKHFTIADVHWINEPPTSGKEYQVKVRYRAESVSCKIDPKADDTYKVTLAKEERALTPGQSAVLYDGERVVGGGVII